MSQADKAEKKIKPAANRSEGWNRDRMNKTHRKGKKKAKDIATSAQRNFAKAVVKGALKSEAPPDILPTAEGLEPHDYARCQAEITTNVNARNFMKMGGKIGGKSRCDSTPTILVSELKVGSDGKRGSMTLCESCWKVFIEKIPNYLDLYTFASIDGIFQYRWDILPEDTRRLFVARGLKRPVSKEKE
jgi:hypothetical protein